jgi:hypothetical protein
MTLSLNSDYFPEQRQKCIVVMVKSCVLFEVRTEFLNSIYTSFGSPNMETLSQNDSTQVAETFSQSDPIPLLGSLFNDAFSVIRLYSLDK